MLIAINIFEVFCTSVGIFHELVFVSHLSVSQISGSGVSPETQKPAQIGTSLLESQAPVYPYLLFNHRTNASFLRLKKKEKEKRKKKFGTQETVADLN